MDASWWKRYSSTLAYARSVAGDEGVPDGLDLINAYRQAFGAEPLKETDPPGKEVGMDEPFVVFAYDQYYPVGGWHDFHSRWPTLEAAKAGVKEARANSVIPGHKEQVYSYYDIVDVRTGKIVDGVEWLEIPSTDPGWQDDVKLPKIN